MTAAVDHDAWPIVAALGIGLLLGLERERRKLAAGHKGTAGVRTFALVALLGALAARTGEPAILAVAGGFVAAAALVGYWRVGDPGLTTEVALVIAFFLGALAETDVTLAAALGVAVTLLLAERTRLQHLVRDTLTEQEVHDGLLLAAAALIVLPLLPDRGIGPGDAFNPVTVWRLVVVVMLISALGYVAQRVLGPTRGLPLAGFLGGFVSSTATIGAMGLRAKRAATLVPAAVAGAIASTIATKVLTAIVLGVADPHVLRATAPALAAGGIVAVACAWLATRRASGRSVSPDALDAGRAFDLKVPVLLALTISAVLALAHVLQGALGDAGALLAIGVAGFADAQSAAVSAASLAAAGRIDVGTAALGVLIALSTNALTKALVALTFGRRREVGRVWGGLAAVLVATWAGFAVWTPGVS